jgi:hypothetical protein
MLTSPTLKKAQAISLSLPNVIQNPEHTNLGFRMIARILSFDIHCFGAIK